MGFRGAAPVAAVVAGSNVAVGGTSTAPTVGTVEDTNAGDIATVLPAGNSAAAGASGKIADAAHTHVASASLAVIVENENQVAASGAAQVLPDVTVDTIHDLVLTANCTLTFPAAAKGKSFLLVLTQDATGSRLVTWPGGGTILWSGGTAPTLTTAGGKSDILSFICVDGTRWLGIVAGQNF